MGLHVITGGSRGLGRSLVSRLLEQGHGVIAAARGAAPTASDRLDWTSVDLADPEAATRWIEDALQRQQAQAEKQAGPVCLILNAAMIDPLAPVRELQADAVDRHLRLNLTVPMLLAARFLRSTESWGVERRILAVSSGAGRRGIPHWGAYCAAKAGLDGFIRALSAEYDQPGASVRAVSLAPGVVDTGMQQTVRETPAPAQSLFVALQANGALVPADETASQMLAYLARDDFGAHVCDDLREALARHD